MSPPIRVPWYTWRRFRVRGVLVEAGSGSPVAGYRVAAFDRDVVSDDFLGDCDTDADGRFEIRFLETDFKDVMEVRPDLYLQVFEPGSLEPLVDTSSALREDAHTDEFFEIRIPGARTGAGQGAGARAEAVPKLRRV